MSGPATPDRTRRRIGTAMRSIALVGVIAAVVVTIALWQFVGDLDRNLERSLVIGEDASATLTETIDVAEEVVASVDAGLVSLATTLDTVDGAVDDGAGVASSTASLAGSLPESFDDIDTALATVESLGTTIDTALRGASRIPLGPDYDPDVPLPEAISSLRSAFDPIGDDLDSIAGELESFAGESETLRADLAAVSADLARTQLALADSQELLDRYRTSAEEAQELAIASRADLGRSLGWARLAVVLIGLVMLTAQLVPWWLGGRLRRNDFGDDPDAGRGDDVHTGVARAGSGV